MAARPARTAAQHPVKRIKRAPAAAARAQVRDFTGAAGFTIDWDVRPVYDFLFSLSEDAGSTEDLPAADRSWLKEAIASLPDGARSASGRLFGTEHATHIAAFAVVHPELRTAGAFVAAIKAASPADVMRAIFSESLHEPTLPALIDRLAAGDESALSDAVACLPEAHREERIALLRDPERTHREIVTVLTAWADRFAPIEARISAMLERDYASRAGDRSTLRGSDLVEKTTGGIRWLGEPGVRRLILAPSYFSRPYNFLLAGPDWRFFGYPLADDAVDAIDPLAPPQSVLRLHRALGDETRLRILKLLADRDLYLTEIAQQLELSKPTIKHHLALLRAAGILTIVESGTVMYYSLRRPRLDDASVELKRFLAGLTENMRDLPA
jgi:DNA-binding transcriptional ArsR family regulator